MTHRVRTTARGGMLLAVLLATGACSGDPVPSTGAPAADAPTESTPKETLPAGSVLWTAPFGGLDPGDGEVHPEGVVTEAHRMTREDEFVRWSLLRPEGPVPIDLSMSFAEVEDVLAAGGDVVAVLGERDGQEGLYGFDIGSGEVLYSIPGPSSSTDIIPASESVLVHTDGSWRPYGLADGEPLDWTAPPETAGMSWYGSLSEDQFALDRVRLNAATGELMPDPEDPITVDGDAVTFDDGTTRWTATGLPPGPDADYPVQFGRLVFQGGQYENGFAVVDAATGEVLHVQDMTATLGITAECTSRGLLDHETLLVQCEAPTDDVPDTLYAITVTDREVTVDVG